MDEWKIKNEGDLPLCVCGEESVMAIIGSSATKGYCQSCVTKEQLWSEVPMVYRSICGTDQHPFACEAWSFDVRGESQEGSE